MPPGIPTRPRPRPISRQDNPLTTGLPLNPNGTYIANPFPTTAAAGGQGSYGAMLPTVNVNGGQNNPFTLPNTQPFATYNPQAHLNLPPVLTAPMTPTTPQITTPNYTPSNVPSYAQPILQAAGGGTPMRDPTMRGADTRLTTDGIIHRLAQDPNSFTQLAPTQQEAIERLLQQSAAPTSNAGTSGTATPGTGDFYGYNDKGERVVKNAANGDDFSKELRWDPQRKKYVQIGTLLKEGRMDKYGRLRKVKKGKGGGRGGGGGSAAAPEVQQTTTGFTGSYGVVNFSTGTG
jgi:hypothetical protein